jgi:hypothetical protein
MHSDKSGLISGVWNILRAAIGPVFDVSVITWNVMPFAAHCDADSKNRHLAEGVSDEDLEYLAELQKLWVQVRQCGSGRECGSVHWQAMWQWELAVWSWQCGVWSVHW